MLTNKQNNQLKTLHFALKLILPIQSNLKVAFAGNTSVANYFIKILQI